MLRNNSEVRPTHRQVVETQLRNLRVSRDVLHSNWRNPTGTKHSPILERNYRGTSHYWSQIKRAYHASFTSASLSANRRVDFKLLTLIHSSLSGTASEYLFWSPMTTSIHCILPTVSWWPQFGDCSFTTARWAQVTEQFASIATAIWHDVQRIRMITRNIALWVEGPQTLWLGDKRNLDNTYGHFRRQLKGYLFSGRMNTALCDFWYAGALDKHLLTYLLT